MTERSSYPHGTPCWVDIGTDLDAALPFYTGLFGWETEAAGPPEETGGYGMFTKGGRLVAGFGPQQNPGPPSWTTYISVDDVDAAVGKAESAGATTVMPATDVMEAGRMAVLQDPQGGFVSLWQARQHAGAEVVNEPGAWSWCELLTRDVEGSKAFYTEVFGWSAETHGADSPMPYTEFSLDGQSIAGMLAMPPMMPDMVPTHWNVYFAVDDLDVARARATELGGQELYPPMEVAAGRFAGLRDPQGATFNVIRLADQEPRS